MLIRQATPDDIPALCRLLSLLFAQEAEFQPDAAAQARGLRAILNDAHVGLILVADEAGRCVGMVNLLWTISTALGTPAAWLEDLIVAPDHRGQGVGSQLIERAFDEATRKGCRRITLLTDASNEAGQAFYARHGFEPSTMRPMRALLKP